MISTTDAIKASEQNKTLIIRLSRIKLLRVLLCVPGAILLLTGLILLIFSNAQSLKIVSFALLGLGALLVISFLVILLVFKPKAMQQKIVENNKLIEEAIKNNESAPNDITTVL